MPSPWAQNTTPPEWKEETLGQVLAGAITRGLRSVGVKGRLARMNVEQPRITSQRIRSSQGSWMDVVTDFPPLRLTIEMDLVEGLGLDEIRAAVFKVDGKPLDLPTGRLISLEDEAL